MKEEKYSPYCKKCGGCGEDGCCSHINCFRSLIEDDTCEYGESYLRAAMLDRDIAIMGGEVINKLENGLYDANLAVKEYHKQWEEIYDKIYTKNDSRKEKI